LFGESQEAKKKVSKLIIPEGPSDIISNAYPPRYNKKRKM